MKKTFYIFLIIFLFFIIFQKIFAYNAKQDLEKIDKFLEKNNSIEKLENISKDLENIFSKKTFFAEKIDLVLNYLYFKTKEKIRNIKSENRKTEILDENHFDKDKNFVKNEILNFQNILLNTIFQEKNLENFDFELNLENKNNSKINLILKNLELNKENIFWKIKFSWKTKNNFLDFSWDFFGVLSSEEFLVKINNFDFKTNNFYEEFTKVKEIFEKNIFVNILEKDNFFKTLKNENLFEIYKIENQNYFLKPSLKFCEILDKKCSKTNYKNFLENFSKNYEIYLTKNWNKTEIYFDFYKNYTENKAKIIFEKQLEKIDFKANFLTYKNENKLFFHYKIWEWFHFELKSKIQEIVWNFKENKLKIDFNWKNLNWKIDWNFWEKIFLNFDLNHKNLWKINWFLKNSENKIEKIIFPEKPNFSQFKSILKEIDYSEFFKNY